MESLVMRRCHLSIIYSNVSMRLTPKQVQCLKGAVARHFGQSAQIWVFGSRIDDQRRGGDYDFYIETSINDPDEIVADKLNVLADLHATPEFEGEKIDIVIRSAVPGPELPIYKVARETGVPL
ncbi:MAG: nucleotidyltransferase domain-containing protein [Thiotrichaceae bacterium]|nr:nucleotidyltransferase domain-containing protein [Thiotrichaceae bacterium]